MNNGISPYKMLNIATKLISTSTKDDFPKERELQVVLLLNRAEEFPNMSHYQLSFSHKALAELYDAVGMSGSALEHYKKALELYDKAPVKRTVSKLEKVPTENLVYGIDGNACGEPDWDNLPLGEKRDFDFSQYGTKHDSFTEKAYKETRAKLKLQAEEDDNIYDPEFEKEIEERLAKLDEESRSEFYRIRTHRKNDGILSAREIDLLTLEAMERSYYHYMGIEYEKPKYKKEFHFGG